ncbi:Uncharacterised protein [Nocardiopsis dassonvillei]|uniref:Uncharacterized protein n=1 Tax=Nocardiopsis dassonvillei (strain ATCC 23218 / DSM 43111 / CIP 107115 / JCM 7437 / KCTC 9190 / NBRC 14626 / NCTC 10488 / NRRL B-5397 / IMRU 509) TaxID=446468 RepID=D7B3T8_NOCDD|nr:hypothetical protein Ndas_3450 [Nocardiopsis dassonvillei subsp. dassonvillei DSM 43111]VEI89364.1 Uncharacterised protein [Nocardiopsis dassonvillei]
MAQKFCDWSLEVKGDNASAYSVGPVAEAAAGPICHGPIEPSNRLCQWKSAHSMESVSESSFAGLNLAKTHEMIQ